MPPHVVALHAFRAETYRRLTIGAKRELHRVRRSRAGTMVAGCVG